MALRASDERGRSKITHSGLYSAALGDSLLSLELGVNLSGVQGDASVVSYLRAEPLTCGPPSGFEREAG